MSLCTAPESRKCTSFIPCGPQKVLLSRGVIQIWFTLYSRTPLGRDMLVLVLCREQCGCCSGSHRGRCLGSYLFLLACSIGLRGLGYSRGTAPRPVKRFPCAALPQLKKWVFQGFCFSSFFQSEEVADPCGDVAKVHGVPPRSVHPMSYPCAPR